MSNFTSPSIQKMNLIRYIGDEVSKSGEPMDSLSGLKTIIDAPSDELAAQLVEELGENGIIKMGKAIRTIDGTTLGGVTLPSLDGSSTKRRNVEGLMKTTASSPCSSTMPLWMPLFGMS